MTYPSDIYEVHFRGQLDPRWKDWFEGFELTRLENGDSQLRGMVRDQSELLGLLEKIGGLNLMLVAVHIAAAAGDPALPKEGEAG